MEAAFGTAPTRLATYSRAETISHHGARHLFTSVLVPTFLGAFFGALAWDKFRRISPAIDVLRRFLSHTIPNDDFAVFRFSGVAQSALIRTSAAFLR